MSKNIRVSEAFSKMQDLKRQLRNGQTGVTQSDVDAAETLFNNLRDIMMSKLSNI